MDTADVADNQLLVGLLSRCNHRFSILNGFGQGLLDKNVSAGLECLDRIFSVCSGIGTDADSVWLGLFQCLLIVAKRGNITSQLFCQALAALGSPADQTYNVELIHLVVSPGVGSSHIPTTDDQNIYFLICHSDVCNLKISEIASNDSRMQINIKMSCLRPHVLI